MSVKNVRIGFPLRVLGGDPANINPGIEGAGSAAATGWRETHLYGGFRAMEPFAAPQPASLNAEVGRRPSRG